MDDELQTIATKLTAASPGAVGEFAFAFGELTLTVDPGRILETLQFLRDDPASQFISIIDISGVDYPQREKRFDVVYHLLSPKLNRRIRLKIETDEDTPVMSATAVYPGADWFEREIYDLFGVIFDGHPDLRRILTDYGFDGHPLRKDFPMTGFVEVRYDDAEKRVRYDPVRLNQEFRQFDFLSPWEGPPLPGDEKANGGGRSLGSRVMNEQQNLRNFSINFGPSIRRRMACCAWCSSSTARWSSGSTHISACCIAAPKNSWRRARTCRTCPISIGSTMSLR